MRFVPVIFGLLLLTPGLSRGDVARPPIMHERDPRFPEIDNRLRWLIQHHGVPVKVLYRDNPGIAVIVPQKYYRAAEESGVTGLANKEVVFELNETPLPLSPVQMALVGSASSLAFISAGIWLARRPERKRVVAVILLLVCSAIVASVVIYSLQISGEIPERSKKTRVGVSIWAGDNGLPFQIVIPKNLKPTWVGSVDEIEVWGEPSAPRSNRLMRGKYDIR